MFGAFRDKLVRGFSVMLHTHAQQNNPTAHVFMWLLADSIPKAFKGGGVEAFKDETDTDFWTRQSPHTRARNR